MLYATALGDSDFKFFYAPNDVAIIFLKFYWDIIHISYNLCIWHFNSQKFF